MSVSRGTNEKEVVCGGRGREGGKGKELPVFPPQLWPLLQSFVDTLLRRVSIAFVCFVPR